MSIIDQYVYAFFISFYVFVLRFRAIDLYSILLTNLFYYFFYSLKSNENVINSPVHKKIH